MSTLPTQRISQAPIHHTHYTVLRYYLVILAIGFSLITIATAQNSTIYTVVLGNQNYVVGSSTLHSGLFVSYDGAESWEHLGPKNLKAYSMDAVEPSGGRILYIAAGNGVHKSTDYGVTWKIVTDWRMTEVLDIKVDQNAPEHLFAATAFGFWISTDGGVQWENPEGLLQNRYCYRIDFGDFTGTSDGSILVSGTDAIYQSLDTGRSWKTYLTITSPRGIFPVENTQMIATSKGPISLAIARSPQNPSLLAAPENMASITFQTTTAPQMFASPPVMNTYDIASGDSLSILACGDKGVWRFNSKTNEWQDITGDIPIPDVHAIAAIPGDEGEHSLILAGTFGEGLFRREGSQWVPAGLEGSQIWRIVVKHY